MGMANTKGATIIKVDEIDKLRYPLPKSLMEAAGLMRHKRKALERHLQKVRKEWDHHRSSK